MIAYLRNTFKNTKKAKIIFKLKIFFLSTKFASVFILIENKF